MKIYLLYNENNVKNLFFAEKIMAPIYYENKFYDYKKNTKDIKNGVIFYKKIPKSILKDDHYILEFEISLLKRDYSKIGQKYIFYNNIYLDEDNVKLNKIFYISDKMYRKFLVDVKLISEAKKIDKYKKKFILLDEENVDFLIDNDCDNEEIENVEIPDIINMEKEKEIYYDSLKGSLCLAMRFYPRILLRNQKQKQIQNDILKMKKMIKLIETNLVELKNEKIYIKSYLQKQIKKYKRNIERNIIQKSKTKDRKKYDIFKVIKNKDIKLNLSIIENKESNLINKIITIIVKEKNYEINFKDREIREEVVKELGLYCKKINNVQLYNDTKLLYAVLINRDLTKNYKSIKNNTIKFLYLALEYYNNIETLNEIVKEYEFIDYPIIYIFTGLIIGYEQLSKSYTDGYDLGIFQRQFDLQLSDIIKDLNNIYITDSYYKKQNCILIENFTREKNYYSLLNIYSLKKRGNYNLNIIRQTRNILNIYIDNKYKIQFSKYRNKEQQGKKVFYSFKYSEIQGKKLNYYKEVELYNILRGITEEIKCNNKG